MNNPSIVVTWRTLVATLGVIAATLSMLLTVGGAIVQFQLHSVSERLEERLKIYLVQSKKQNDDIEAMRERVLQLERKLSTQ